MLDFIAVKTFSDIRMYVLREYKAAVALDQHPLRRRAHQSAVMHYVTTGGVLVQASLTPEPLQDSDDCERTSTLLPKNHI